MNISLTGPEDISTQIIHNTNPQILNRVQE